MPGVGPLPPAVQALLRQLADGLPALLGKDLVGLYVYGSLTQDAFQPERSDIDCILVTERDLSDAQFEAFSVWLAEQAAANPWYLRLQMTCLVRDGLLREDTRGCLYQLGTLQRCGSDGNPIIWRNVLDSGLTVYGPPPEDLVPHLTPDMLDRALVLELHYLCEELANEESAWRDHLLYRAYAVLTVCRILHTHESGQVVSKPAAAAWALESVDERWHDLIRDARSYQEEGREPDMAIDRIQGLVNDALRVVEA